MPACRAREMRGAWRALALVWLPVAWAQDASLFAEAVRLVRESQFRPAAACAAAPGHVFPPGAHTAGFASGVHVVSSAFSSALLEDRVFAVESGRCRPTRGHSVDVACAWGDLFKPVTNCSVAAVGGKRSTKASGAGRFKLSPGVFAKYGPGNHTASSEFVSGLSPRLRRAPAFFWAAVLSSVLFRPRPCLLDRVAALEAAIGGPANRALGIHARYTDKGAEALTHDVGEYVEAAAALAAEAGYRRAFVCSDDTARAKKIKDLLQKRSPHLRVTVASVNHPGSNTRGGGGGTGAGCSNADAAAVAAEIALLARAHGLVGTLSSNIGRLVHELQAADTLSAQRRPADAGAGDDDDAPLDLPRFFDLDGIAASWMAGDGVVDNSIRGFWQHYALQ